MDVASILKRKFRDATRDRLDHSEEVTAEFTNLRIPLTIISEATESEFLGARREWHMRLNAQIVKY